MNILWLSWKDLSNPQAGGAELVNEQIAERLVRDGHKLIFLVSGFPGSKKKEERNGYTIIRLGNRFTVYWEAYKYCKKELLEWPDKVIEEVNTVPFFAGWYFRKPVLLFFHQLCREIWFYQMKFPFSFIGYFLEPVYLFLLRKNKTVTISESTKKDLIRFGFFSQNISIIPEGITLSPLSTLSLKRKPSILLSFGAFRPMKRTLDHIKAFEIAKVTLTDLQLYIAGNEDGKYGEKVLELIRESPFCKDIHFFGKVSEEQKVKLMQESHLILVTSVKEGWGLIVTEANSQGTPAVVYNVDGLRDSVQDNITGLLTEESTPECLSKAIIQMLQNQKDYDRMRKQALEWSRVFSFEESYKAFSKILSAYE